jgi:hypothetical protein
MEHRIRGVKNEVGKIGRDQIIKSLVSKELTSLPNEKW